MNIMLMCDQAVSSFGEETQSDPIILFRSEIGTLSHRTIPTQVPALACVSSAWGRQWQRS